jgi:hypothetical protein
VEKYTFENGKLVIQIKGRGNNYCSVSIEGMYHDLFMMQLDGDPEHDAFTKKKIAEAIAFFFRLGTNDGRDQMAADVRSLLRIKN